MINQTYPWVSFSILMALGSLTLFLALPRPLKVVSFLVSLAVLGVIVGVGLLLSKSSGLNAFSIIGDASGGDVPQLTRSFFRAALVGLGLGTILLLAIRFLLPSVLPEIQARFTAEASVAVWKRFVIAFDSAVLEEIVFRLVLFSGLVWLVGKTLPTQSPPNAGTLWMLNALIAIGFGLAHLPQWSTITPLTPLVVLSVVFLNSLGGLTFGWLYFTDGLASAMLAHFAADVVLHVIGPGFLQN